ncbi:MAG TPA: Asp-tRNA(Asn)/Glu-tRNA(Gln) amidotransferase GatCAB subunit B, partial [Erythrobacter sp.]|nr:Asp-tRNA(Asn)/Glu-tRNA(Gln) amidotransferase GatCAB subunit B [Erythrobacter sp.]
NVSVRKPGGELGTRTETKNVNSVRFVMQVIEYEANRQVDVIENGGSVDQETRLFDPGTGTTRTMRSKEDAHDYRYFPDPDLLPLELEDSFLEECRASLPELPDAKRKRYESELGLTPYNARELTAEVETFARFETLLAATAAKIGKSEAKVATQVANWALSVAPGVVKSLDDEADMANATAAAQASILAMQDKG